MVVTILNYLIIKINNNFILNRNVKFINKLQTIYNYYNHISKYISFEGYLLNIILYIFIYNHLICIHLNV